MLAVQFEKTGENAQIDLNDYIKPSTVGTFNWDDGSPDPDYPAPTIRVLKSTGAGYNIYYYINNCYETEESEEMMVGNYWANSDGFKASELDIQAIGDGFLYRAATMGESLTVNGQVHDALSITKTVNKANINKVFANSQPTALCLEGNVIPPATIPAGVFDWDEGSPDPEHPAPSIRVLKSTGAGYETYYFINNCYENEEAMDTMEGDHWADSDGFLCTYQKPTHVPALQSFYFRSVNGTGNLTIKK